MSNKKNELRVIDDLELKEVSGGILVSVVMGGMFLAGLLGFTIFVYTKPKSS